MPHASEQTREDFLHLTLAALQSNPDVVGVWLVGSLAAGTSDPYSDIDLRVVVRAESLERFLDELPAFSRSFSDSVFVQRRGSLINVVTRDWLRLDLFVIPDKDLSAPAGPSRIVFDRQGALAAAQEPADEMTDAEWAKQTVNEFIRCLGLLPFVAGREEWISAYLGTLWMLQVFVDLLQIVNGLSRRVGGALSVGQRLTAEQRELMEEIPLLRPERASVVATQVWMAKQFLPRARKLFTSKGWEYPKEFEQSTLEHLKGSGIEI